MSTILQIVLPTPKFPDEVIDWEIDWSEVVPAGDEIVSVTVASAGGGGVTVDRHSTAALLTVVWISGGAPASTPSRLQLLATTTAGRKIGVNIVVPVSPR